MSYPVIIMAISALLVLSVAAEADDGPVVHPGADGTATLDMASAVKCTAGWGTPHEDASVEGKPLRIGSAAFPHGIGTHAPAEVVFRLDGSFRWFSFFTGVSADMVQAGSITVQVWLDGRQDYETPVMRVKEEPVFVCVPVEGVRELRLVGTDAGDGNGADHVNLCELRLTTTAEKPLAKLPPAPRPVTITPVTDTAGLMPRHGTVSLYPATKWEDSLATGNGRMGALLAGDPQHDTLIVNHCKMWLPLGSHEVVPDVGKYLPELRRVIHEQGYDAGQRFFEQKAREQGWDGKLIWTDPFHPAFFLKIDQPTEGDISDYARVENFSTGEVWVQWQTPEGAFSRRMFVSRTENVIVLRLTGPKGKLSVRLTVPPVGNPLIKSSVVHAADLVTCHNVYVNGKGGYDGAVRVGTNGGQVTCTGGSISIANADAVTLVMRVEPFQKADARSLPKLTRALADLPMSYEALLKPHAAAHGARFNRVSLDLGGIPAERGMASETLLDLAQKEHRLPAALLERMYDAGRYVFLCSAGPDTPPNLFGIWTGTWQPMWSGDYTLDTNIQLDIECALSGNLAEGLAGCFALFERFMPDMRTNGCGSEGISRYSFGRTSDA